MGVLEWEVRLAGREGFSGQRQCWLRREETRWPDPERRTWVGGLVAGLAMTSQGNQIPVDHVTACPGARVLLSTFLPPTDVPRFHQDAPRAVHPHGSFREPLWREAGGQQVPVPADR